MNFEELDIALEELETRLERLRALYEQYFLGFEKIEPSVARKDVDRRIYVLRREKIRNTGKRFKLQTIIQRYNTFQQYWQRICREIENGTYKRHLARAERILGAEDMLTIAARRRFGKAAAEQMAANAEVEPAPSDESPLDEIEDDGSGISEAGFPPAAFRPEPGTDRAPLPPIPRTSIPSPNPLAMGTAPPPAAVASKRPSKFESLELDMDFLDSWDPETSVRARNRGSAPKEDAARPVAPARPVESTRPISEEKRAPEPERERPKSSPKAAPPPKPQSPPEVALPPPKPARAVPPPKPAKPAAAPSAAAAQPKVAAQAKSGTLSDERIQELHQSLMRIKRENKEPGQVSVESLAKTLRATEEKLRQEHKNRRIEFEVVLRDGKAVVKPKVR